MLRVAPSLSGRGSKTCVENKRIDPVGVIHNLPEIKATAYKLSQRNSRTLLMFQFTPLSG